MFILFWIDFKIFGFGFLSYRKRIGMEVRSIFGLDSRDYSRYLKNKKTKTFYIDIFYKRFEFEI